MIVVIFSSEFCTLIILSKLWSRTKATARSSKLICQVWYTKSLKKGCLWEFGIDVENSRLSITKFENLNEQLQCWTWLLFEVTRAILKRGTVPIDLQLPGGWLHCKFRKKQWDMDKGNAALHERQCLTERQEDLFIPPSGTLVKSRDKSLTLAERAELSPAPESLMDLSRPEKSSWPGLNGT